MHDLIYRDDLIKSLPVDWPTTVRAIEEAPAVDAVEVVRCRECIYAEEGTVTLPVLCRKHGFYNMKGGFCNYAESRRK